MKTAQKKGMLKLPKTKSQVRKAWERIFDLGFHYMVPRWQMVVIRCLPRLGLGIVAERPLGRSVVLGMERCKGTPLSLPEAGHVTSFSLVL